MEREGVCDGVCDTTYPEGQVHRFLIQSKSGIDVHTCFLQAML